MRSPRHASIAVAVAAAVVTVDAATKAVAAHALAGGGAVRIGGGVRLLLYRNHAGPGNALQGHPVLVSSFVLVAVLAMAAAALHARTRAGAVVLGLMLGGGAGNLADRLLRAPGPLRGGVIDWIQPRAGGGSMNLADLSLNLALLVALGSVVIPAGRRRLRATEAA